MSYERYKCLIVLLDEFHILVYTTFVIDSLCVPHMRVGRHDLSYEWEDPALHTLSGLYANASGIAPPGKGGVCLLVLFLCKFGLRAERRVSDF